MRELSRFAVELWMESICMDLSAKSELSFSAHLNNNCKFLNNS